MKIVKSTLLLLCFYSVLWVIIKLDSFGIVGDLVAYGSIALVAIGGVMVLKKMLKLKPKTDGQ